jgi:RNA polymerase sigma factor for flagellar operon FliA
LSEFHQLLDETKMVSVVALEEGRKSAGGHGGYIEPEVLETIQDDNARDALLAVHFAGLQSVMVQAIEALPDKEKLLISLYYYEELTMKEIGQIMGYTESRISQLHTQAMYRLKHKLREYSQEV